MIITSYGVIVLPLIVWVGVLTAKSRKSACKEIRRNMFGISYPAMRSRHEVCIETYAVI